jgi:ech hydrogenase subunit B
MMDWYLGLGLFLLTLPAIGLLLGFDRILTARLQNRVGPPLWQPLLDLGKLFGKEGIIMNKGQVVFALMGLLLQAAAMALLCMGGDLIVIFFLSGSGSFMLVLGAFSALSPFSHLGAQRELLQIIAYEPVFFLAIVCVGWYEGTFMVEDLEGNLLGVLPLVVLALVPVLMIKMQKSPLDLATAHQELVSGPYVEYSGPYLGLMKLAHWFELAVLLGIISLFYSNEEAVWTVLGRFVLVMALVIAVVVIDNTTARLTRGSVVLTTLVWGLVLVGVNLLILTLFDLGGMS